MDIRGERECRACGTTWSYFETDSVTCPACGSPRSVGIGDRAVHTDSAAGLDLTAARSAVDDRPLRDAASEAAQTAAEYVRDRGFVRGGEIQPLADTYLAAAELKHLGRAIAGDLRVDDAVELYFLDLLSGAEEGRRPDPAEVPDPARDARGRAIAEACGAVQSDLRRVLDDPDPGVADLLGAIRTHRKRIEALEGDVDPAEAERLVRAVRDLLTGVRDADEAALATGLDRLQSSLV